MIPSPETTLGILLGASEWPHAKLKSSPAFANSAKKVKEYFLDPCRFGLRPENWLDLFNTNLSTHEIDQTIGKFLQERISQMKQAGTPAQDVLFYYIGHGMLAFGPHQAFHLAVRNTDDKYMRSSAIAMAALADTLKTNARQLRRIVILDCCFAAESSSYMMQAEEEATIQKQMIADFEVRSIGSGFPQKGTALFCSSGSKDASLLLPDESGTMFSEAFITAVAQGTTYRQEKTYLSLYDLRPMVEDVLETLSAGSAPRPYLHSPDQSEGDVAQVPFFPNNPMEKRKSPVRPVRPKTERRSVSTLTAPPATKTQADNISKDRLTRQKRGKRKSSKLARQTFVEALTAGPPMVWFHVFALLTGLGVLAELLNRLTLLLPWTTAPLTFPGVGLLANPSAIGIVVLAAPLLYFLGYRKALSPFTMLCLAIISALAIYSLTGFLSSLNFAQYAASPLWFNQTRMLWLGRQVVFGLIMGGIVGVLYGIYIFVEYQDWGEVGSTLLVTLVFGLIGWLIPAALSFFFHWGFGFGYTWYISIVSAVVSCLVVASLFFSFFLWRRASETSSASASWQLDIPMPEVCQQSSIAALRIVTTRPEAIDLLFTLDDHQEEVQSVALSADGLILASSSSTKDIKIWDTQTGQLVRRLTDDEYRTSCIAMSANGYFLASGYGSDRSIKLWNTQTNQVLRTFKRDTYSTDLALALSGNEQLLAIDSQKQSIDLWNIQNGQYLRMATGHKYSIKRMALSADGAILASGCAVEKAIKLWDTQSGELIHTLNRLKYSPRCLALNADGSLLASSCDYEQTIELWNTHTGQLLHTLTGHGKYVESLALSADGLILASGSDDETIKLWNTQTGWLLRTLTGHTKGVRSVALSADGLLLASGSDDQTVRLWGVKA